MQNRQFNLPVLADNYALTQNMVWLCACVCGVFLPLYFLPGCHSVGHKTLVSSAKCSTAAQCVVYYHTSGLLGRHGKAFERNKHQGRGSFMLNFGLGSCRRISKKQDWCTVWGFCRESYQSTAVSPDSLQLITYLLIQPNHSCMENQRRLGSV